MAGGDIHPFLCFEEGSDQALKLASIQHKPLLEARTIDWDVLEKLGETERATALLPDPWRRFFAIKHPQYRVLVLEFCSTFQFDHQAKTLTDEKAITFRLGGKSHNMSIARLGKLMDIYKENELRKNLFKKGLRSLEGTASHELWAEIGTGIYRPKATKRTQMKDPLHRYIHRAISNTISARGFSTGVVSAKDMFFLFCLIRNQPCNLAFSLAQFFSTCFGRTHKSPIVGGSYITQLAISLDVLNAEIRDTLESSHPTDLIGTLMVQSMKLARYERGLDWHWLDSEGKRWIPGAADAGSEDGMNDEDLSESEPEGNTAPPPPSMDLETRINQIVLTQQSMLQTQQSMWAYIQWMVQVQQQAAQEAGYVPPPLPVLPHQPPGVSVQHPPNNDMED
ncbi:hypothetical protein E3N88_37991 [Mikania micrantha]|uniref:Arabidopsis retrotransposon Orf1 C-terminal domain-containing protein n=1 Tax=Mikania micrantha TaxID=192012 RepID=A0A5N6LSP5_9ASTR|nr:hypothetical protein E3N88_37991 [Mikania micrantha]